MKMMNVDFAARPCSMLWASRQWLAFYRQALFGFLPAGFLGVAALTHASGMYGEPRAMIAVVGATLIAPAVRATYRYFLWRRWTRR
jgi:hypothetical protein